MGNYWKVLAAMPQIVALLGTLGPLFDKSAKVSQPMVDSLVQQLMGLFGKLLPSYKNLSNEEIVKISSKLNALAWEVKQDIEDVD